MLSLQELLVGTLLMLPFILLPTFIGLWRGHPNKPGLVAVNILLLPFFGIGWVLALIWAITVPESNAGTRTPAPASSLSEPTTRPSSPNRSHP